MSSKRLKQELIQAGAKVSEVNELNLIASKLKLLRKEQANRNWIQLLKPVAIALPALLISAVIVMYSQSLSPTSWLYPVQKATDAVAIKASPSYRAIVMMRRAQQVNQLVAAHASPRIILATLASYDSEAASYKNMPHANYAAFEYCKANLEQAANDAPTKVKQAINASLDNLKSV